MAYSDFTLEKVKTAFDLEVVEGIDLFLNVQAIAPSLQLASTLAKTVPLASAIKARKSPLRVDYCPCSTRSVAIFGCGECESVFRD